MGHASFQLNRRQVLKMGLAGAGALALGPAFLRRAFAAGPVTVGDGPYGPLKPFNADGIALPEGFSSREIARGGDLVAGSNPPYVWHPATDGQATFPTLGTDGAPDGGWILTANSEMPIPGTGGVSGVEFAPDGDVESAYRVLAGTFTNCAGGPTPWGTWLSCEEHDEGRVWECDPTGAAPGIPRPAMGIFKHEAACVDPIRKQVYLTEDEGDGCLYRFTPGAYPDLSAGLLELAVVDGSGNVTWAEVPNPGGGALDPTREQVAAAAHFDGGEGTWYDDGNVYFTTKGDGRVWVLHVERALLEVLYDPDVVGPDAPLSGVDNITVSRSGDIYVCEDGRDHDICLITPEFEVARFLKLDPVAHAGPPPGNPVAGNETVGVVFSPDGTRMYFGAQRSFGLLSGNLPRGVVYEISGPFRNPGGTGGGGGGGGGPVGGAAGPPTTPRSGLLVPRRWRIGRFLRHGLPLELELDGATGVEASLHIHGGGRGGHPRPSTIGRAEPGVALEGTVALMVEPTDAAARRLRGRERVGARLRVVLKSAGETRVEWRRVQLHRGD